MKAKTFAIASFFLAVGAIDIGIYSHSVFLAAGVLMTSEGLLIGMLMPSLK